jgi:imidazolonepropionase-like amidohydrolase
MIRAGADVIKVSASGGFLSEHDDPEHPNFLQEELDAIVKTAADLGRPVMAHAHGAEPIKRAIRAGVRSIEHGTYLDDEAIEMMVTNGTWLVPTLTAGDTTEQMANDPALPEAVRRKFEGLGRPELESFRRAAAAGVKVAMGTDCPVAPHGTNLRELALMTEGGYSPTQALVAATAHAAELMGLDADLGTLEEGKIADVVVVDGDPFAFDTLPDRIEQVWKDGTRVV